MNVDFIDLKKQNKEFEVTAIREITKIVRSSDFIFGNSVKKFEQDFGDYLKTNHCIGVGSGTDGILLSLLALNISSGDEVIAPTLTFSASVSPIILLGAKPILVDSMKDKPLIDPEEIKKSITKKTKAIIMVHLFGMPCNINEILRIAKKNKIPVIEDAAQAHGSLYGGKALGTFGDIGVFSFYPSKNLGAFGDAGAVVTNRKNLADKIRAIQNHGQKTKDEHDILGINSRLDSIQAAVLRIKLKSLNAQNKKRGVIATLYKKLLKPLPVKIFSDTQGSFLNHHIFTIKTKGRNALMKYLHDNGVQSRLYYLHPVHKQKFFRSRFENIKLPISEKYSRELLALPIHPNLTSAHVRKVSSLIKTYFEKQ